MVCEQKHTNPVLTVGNSSFYKQYLKEEKCTSQAKSKMEE